MKKEFQYFMLLSVLNFILFTGTFALFQKKAIYDRTLGRVSENYVRTGDWDHYEIKKEAVPFVEVTNEQFDRWDASIYKCMSEHIYSLEASCYAKVRPAFFPLFPLFWKAIHSSAITISILNYFIYSFSVALLLVFLLDTTLFNKMITYAILITLPSSIHYCIPYSESLFLLTGTIALIGIIQKRYWMYFIGCLLLAMVRPATVFVLFAFLLAEAVIFMQHKNMRTFIKEAALKSVPFILGYAIVVYMQQVYTGSWTALFDARKFWNPTVSFDHFSDWSVEGFALSVFAACFICLPGILFVFSLIFFKNKTRIASYLSALHQYKNAYLFFVSVIYLIGIFGFSLATQGLDFHSFSRYILSSPLFYIAVLILLNRVYEKPRLSITFLYCTIILLTIWFLRNVECGGDKVQLSFLGLYLFMLIGFFLLIKDRFSQSLQICMVLGIIVLNTVWNTYLLNMFFSNGWIFT